MTTTLAVLLVPVLLAAAADLDECDGYVVLRGFFSEDEVEQIRANVSRFVQEVGPTLPPGELMYEDRDRPETLKRLAHVDRHDAWFREFLHAGRSAALAEHRTADG